MVSTLILGAVLATAQSTSGISNPVVSNFSPPNTAAAQVPVSSTSYDHLVTPRPRPPSGAVLTTETRGDIYMARKMFREAVEMYRQSPQDSAVIANKTGIAYHQMLDLRDAKKCYQQSVKLDPEYPEAINNLGAVDYGQKHYSRAIREYKKALRYAPTSASIFSNLGTAYFAKHKYKDAVSAYQQALALDPEVFERHGETGILLEERNIVERAKFHFFLARLYAQKGMNDLALVCIRKSLEEGFKDRKKYVEDPEFAKMQALPEFQHLLALEPRVL